MFYSDAMCNTPGYLVSGPSPVPDDKLTASTAYVETIPTNPQGFHGASEARLNNQYVTLPNGTFTAGIWAPQTADTDQYIQVSTFNVFFTTLNIFGG